MTDDDAVAAATTVTPTDSLGIVIPDTWIDIPTDRRQFDRFSADLRRRWRTEGQWDRTTQRQGDVLLARIRGELGDAGLAFSALFISEPTDEDRAGAVPLPGGDLAGENDDVLMAACTVGVYTKESLDAPADLTLGNLTMAFGRKAKQQPGGDDKRYRNITNLEPPMYHELAVGKSIRLRRLYELRSAGLLPQRFFGESFLVPVGEHAKRCIIAHFVTMNLKLARPFSALFEEIAGTLTYLDGEPAPAT